MSSCTSSGLLAIAVQLFISGKTVEYHLGNIYAKCGLQGRQQLRRSSAMAPAGRDLTGPGCGRLTRRIRIAGQVIDREQPSVCARGLTLLSVTAPRQPPSQLTKFAARD